MRAEGSLCLHQGVLWVGRWAKTAHLRAYDLDGRPLDAGFSFCDSEQGRSTASGVAIDEERRLWVADAAGRRVRTFNLFGAELSGLARDEELERKLPPAASERERGDLPGALGEPVAVAVGTAEVLGGPSDGAPLILVGSGGERRHALQAFDAESGRWIASLRSEGHARGAFRGVRRVVADGRDLWVVEAGRERLQVFRAGEFHYSVQLRGERDEVLLPTAVAPLGRGAFLAAWEAPDGGLGIFDSGGALQRRLARAGEAEGELDGPEDLAVEPGPDPRHTRVAVLDRAGVRVQVFTLTGRCFGAFEEQVS